MKLRKILALGVAVFALFGIVVGAGCTANVSQTDPIVGQWISTYREDGNTYDSVFSATEDGDMYLLFIGDGAGLQVEDARELKWEHMNDTFYKIIDKETNDSRVLVYNPESDTATGSKSQKFTRLDPIVGFWFTNSVDENGIQCKSSVIFRHTGQGYVYQTYTDGTARAFPASWSKDTEGLYTINFANKKSSTKLTINDEGNIASALIGDVLTKCYLDSSFLMPVTGLWYCADTNTLVSFDADGTGFVNSDTGVLNCTWDNVGTCQYELTYSSSSETNSLSNELKEIWIYNCDSNTLVNASGKTFVRPSESVPDKISVY